MQTMSFKMTRENLLLLMLTMPRMDNASNREACVVEVFKKDKLIT